MVSSSSSSATSPAQSTKNNSSAHSVLRSPISSRLLISRCISPGLLPSSFSSALLPPGQSPTTARERRKSASTPAGQSSVRRMPNLFMAVARGTAPNPRSTATATAKDGVIASSPAARAGAGRHPTKRRHLLQMNTPMPLPRKAASLTSQTSLLCDVSPLTSRGVSTSSRYSRMTRLVCNDLLTCRLLHSPRRQALGPGYRLEQGHLDHQVDQHQ